MASWRVVPLTRAPVATQLARSEALWREVAAGEAPPTLRWYGYDSAAVVLGFGQSPAAVDAPAAARAGVAVVQRTSGGTAVLADETLFALDVAVPAGHHRAGTDILEAYRWVGGAFCRALATLAPGGAGRLALVTPLQARADQAAQRQAPPGSPGALRGLACFGTLSPFEVCLAGQGDDPPAKLVGLSQVRKRGVVLVQAGLYTTVRPGALAALLAIDPGERAVLADELGRRVAGLGHLGLSGTDVEVLCQRVIAAAIRD